MKKLLIVLPLFLLFLGCNISEECVRNSGSIRTKDFPAAGFNKIYVYPGISLVVASGDGYAIKVSAGSNVIDDISVSVQDSILTLRDNSGCNLVRDYGSKTVYVTADKMEILEIYSNTAKPITSEGVLTFPILRLYAMDSFGGVATGDFDMNVDNTQLVVQSNNISCFKVAGHTNEMLLNFYDDMGRFDGPDLIANTIQVFQRSSNDMIVHPVQSISGDIYSTGNIICKVHPVTDPAVVEHYTGRLIFE